MVNQAAFSDIWPWILGCLATVLCLSGIDDLIPSLICFWHIAIKKTPDRSIYAADEISEERRIAIFVPCWKESEVIGEMVRHNLAAIRYRNYDFFLGVYPNDKATMDVATMLARTFRNVHVAACPHPGPTSKADCLNWVYQRMVLFEEQNGTYFDTVTLHDAEDLIHPEALAVINRERVRNAMVQVPVLPLATPFGEFTHGVYCDDFAEYQSVDMRARQFCDTFLPSCGVGTGLARHVLERLASERNNLVFDPASLTEDYETGVYVFNAGYRQSFAPLRPTDKGLLATREYFPRRFRSAIRQRTRWVTGIALQSWARDGWYGSWKCKYWFWRDRKGLLANPISLLTNLLFVAGLADLLRANIQHQPWIFAVSNPVVLTLCSVTSALQVGRTAMRMFNTGRIYGVPFALGVPLRTFHANYINCFASLGALWRYAHAKLNRRPLVWLKTDHAYPRQDALMTTRNRNLCEVLVSESLLSEEKIRQAQVELQSDAYLAEFLLARGILSEHSLCEAVSLQSGVPFTSVDWASVKPRVVRSLPAQIERRFGVIPFRVEHGRLMFAGTKLPAAALHAELGEYTPLSTEFHLVTKQDYEKLRSAMYGEETYFPTGLTWGSKMEIGERSTISHL